jgi:hypothetical protein
MFARHLIAAAALVGLMTTGAMVGSAAAQTTAPAAAPAAPAAKPAAKPMAKKAMPMKKAAAKKAPMHKAGGMKMKMSKEGHKMDNVADKLNACETKPAADRSSCISDATKM